MMKNIFLKRIFQFFNVLLTYLYKNQMRLPGVEPRVYCLEGNYPNRWTTNALISVHGSLKYFSYFDFEAR